MQRVSSAKAKDVALETVMKRVVAAGAEPNTHNPGGWSPWDVALLYGASDRVLRTMAELGLRPDFHGKYGTGLHWLAAFRGDDVPGLIRMATTLRQLGMDIGAKNEAGLTAAELAREVAHLGVMEALS